MYLNVGKSRIAKSIKVINLYDLRGFVHGMRWSLRPSIGDIHEITGRQKERPFD